MTNKRNGLIAAILAVSITGTTPAIAGSKIEGCLKPTTDQIDVYSRNWDKTRTNLSDSNGPQPYIDLAKSMDPKLMYLAYNNGTPKPDDIKGIEGFLKSLQTNCEEDKYAKISVIDGNLGPESCSFPNDKYFPKASPNGFYLFPRFEFEGQTYSSQTRRCEINNKNVKKPSKPTPKPEKTMGFGADSGVAGSISR